MNDSTVRSGNVSRAGCESIEISQMYVYMDVEKLCVFVEYVSKIANIQRCLCKYHTYSRRQWHYALCEKLINIRLLMFIDVY